MRDWHQVPGADPGVKPIAARVKPFSVQWEPRPRPPNGTTTTNTFVLGGSEDGCDEPLPWCMARDVSTS